MVYVLTYSSFSLFSVFFHHIYLLLAYYPSLLSPSSPPLPLVFGSELRGIGERGQEENGKERGESGVLC